jgi:methionine transaminase
MSALATETNAINLSQGFPDYPPDAQLLACARHSLDSFHHQYVPMPGLALLRDQIRSKYSSVMNVDVDSDKEITVTSGATSAIYTALASVVRSGSEVIVLTPAYDSYAPAVVSLGGVVVECPLDQTTWLPDWDRVRSAVTRSTVAIVVNTPHNPTGSVFSRFDWQQLELIAEHYNLIVISDEVYELINFSSDGYSSALQFPDLRNRTFVITSFGKTFHVTGWKIGACVACTELTNEFRKIHQYLTFCSNGTMQHALAMYMERGVNYRALSEFFAQKKQLFLDSTAASILQPLTSVGSYFVLFDYSMASQLSDVDFAKQLTTSWGVACIPLSPFGAKDVKVVRFCFAKADATLKRAGELLSRIPAM